MPGSKSSKGQKLRPMKPNTPNFPSRIIIPAATINSPIAFSFLILICNHLLYHGYVLYFLINDMHSMLTVDFQTCNPASSVSDVSAKNYTLCRTLHVSFTCITLKCATYDNPHGSCIDKKISLHTKPPKPDGSDGHMSKLLLETKLCVLPHKFVCASNCDHKTSHCCG